MNKILSKRSAAAAAIALVAGSITAPANAEIACTKTDCWYAGDRVEFSGVKVTYRPDTDLDKVEADKSLTWHEKDNLHNWLSGYWLFGNWYNATPQEIPSPASKKK